MQLIKYSPFKELQKMQNDLDRFWDFDWNIGPTLQDWSTMDMYLENGTVVAEFILPNFTKKEIHVSTENGMLEVSAEHKEKEEEKKKRNYYLRESSNRFWRRVALPEGAKTNKIDAVYREGILKITMPLDKKSIQSKSKTVPIK